MDPGLLEVLLGVLLDDDLRLQFRVLPAGEHQGVGRHVAEHHRPDLPLWLADRPAELLLRLGHDPVERLLVRVPELQQVSCNQQIGRQPRRRGRHAAEGQRRRVLQDERREQPLLRVAAQADGPHRLLPLLEQPDHRLRVADLQERPVLDVIGLVLQPRPAAQHLRQRPRLAGFVLVGLQLDVAVERLQGRGVVALPGADQADVVPGGRLLGELLGELLERLGGVGQLAGAGPLQGLRPRLARGRIIRSRQELVILAGHFRQPRVGAEHPLERLPQLLVARLQSNRLPQRRPCGHRVVQLQLTVGDQLVQIRQCVVGVRRIGFDGPAEQHQGADQFPFGEPELAAQQQAERIIRVDVERLLECLFGLVKLAVGREELGLPAPGLGVAGVGRDDPLHGAQGRLVLAVGVLGERAVDLGVDVLTAPLEFFAAAARARGVRVGRHV